MAEKAKIPAVAAPEFKILKKGTSVTFKGKNAKGGTKTGKIKSELADYIGLGSDMFEPTVKAAK